MATTYNDSHGAEKGRPSDAHDSSVIIDHSGDVYETSDSRRQLGLWSAIFL
jgi:hypothetical protein